MTRALSLALQRYHDQAAISKSQEHKKCLPAQFLVLISRGSDVSFPAFQSMRNGKRLMKKIPNMSQLCS